MRIPSFFISSLVMMTISTTTTSTTFVCNALQFPSLPKIFGLRTKNNNDSKSILINDNNQEENKKVQMIIEQTKSSLLQAVSFTNNGKDATTEKQREVLKIVRSLELQKPPSPTLLQDSEAKTLLDGTWYLQYTSPSEIESSDNYGADKDDDDLWKPQFSKEGDANIPTNQYNAKGTVTAAGITVDTSNKVVKQILNIDKSTVTNDVTLDFGRVVVGGPFRPSSNVPNRVLVAFNQATIIFNNGIEINFGFVFDIIRSIQNSTENGWLEVTYVDDDIRIGRGNKGTMFVLTRDVNAVKS